MAETLLDILTLNLWGLPWPAARQRPQRKRLFADHLADAAYDIIGVQELWWPWRRTLAPLGLHLPTARRDSGLALGTNLPLRGRLELEAFRATAGVDRLKRKGVLHGRVVLPEGRGLLRVCVTHCQAEPSGAGVRERQVQQLVDILRREHGAVLLMGDFNFYRELAADRRSAERLADAGLVDVAETLGHQDQPTYCPDTNSFVRRRRRPAERFDRILVRDGGGVRLVPRQIDVLGVTPAPFSDHHPVRARVALA